MNQKTGPLIISISMLLSIAQITTASASNLTTDADKVESFVEITNIMDKEVLKSIDSNMFDIFYTVADSNFLWSPDGSRLLILTHRNMATKGDTKRVPCGEFGLHERASTLFWMYADGSEVTNIARAEVSIRAAKNNTAAFLDSAWWSPDGDKIVFMVLNPCDEKTQKYVSYRNGSILADNSTVNQLPLGWSFADYEDGIKLSPDGEKIAFIGDKDGEVYTVNVDNASVQQLTTNSDMQAIGLSWKPDGKKLVIITLDALYVIDADGSNLRLIEKGEDFYLASWSPDGTKIIFTKHNENGDFENLRIYYIDTGTTKTVDEKWASQISWSPNGDKIAFRSARASSLYIVNSDGTDKITLPESYSARMESAYVWGMDNEIYYMTNDSIVKIKPDGTERLLLVKNVPTDVYNSNKIYLSPDGSRILFTVGRSTGREQVYLLKMKGYDEVISIYAPSSIKQGDAALIEVKSISKPVENATVLLNGREIGKTNESGFLEYSFKEAGNFGLSAVKQGFRTANMSITIKEQSPEPIVITTATPAPTVGVNTPRTPGFSIIFAVFTLILTIYQIKKMRRINETEYGKCVCNCTEGVRR
ncbi:MAG: PEGA domain-containing protein [Candidatus Methanoperedens sp.]|nr:PEGA domain-containing protein [Candidatus Methanoperedens sp.]MCZ7369748.1 PEGA domain-containing protein [Candidatus Methanoperedens sp.]